MTAPQIIANRFEIGDLIGQGGMGRVYKGYDRLTEMTVAIKALKADAVADDPNLLERFHRESEVLRKLDHPNIVSMLADVEEQGAHYIVMEYVGGGSLSELMADGPMPVERVLELALDLADALARAHRLKVIHRDIKPQNVLLAEDGTPRLTDFGVALMTDRGRITHTNSLIGTVSYLSPEVCMGESYEERSDIWSFGIMLYEMLTGERPFDQITPAGTIMSILNDPLPPITGLRPDLPPALADLIGQMLQKTPTERVPSVRSVGAALETIIRGLDTAIVNVSPALREVHVADESRFDTPGEPSAPVSPPLPAPRRPGEPRVFITYRREERSQTSDRIAAYMVETFGAQNVIKDVDRLMLRTVSRFVLANDTVASSDALLIIIGPGWTTARDPDAPGGLNDPKDLVRLEIEAGLRSETTKVFAVLVDGAAMPPESTLPEALRALPRQETMVVRDTSFETDMKRLTAHIRRHVEGDTAGRRRSWLRLALTAALLLLAALLLVPRALELTQPAEVPTVEPVAPGESMVLVAEMEAVGTAPRDVTRFIVDDLTRQLQEQVPSSQVRVRRLAQVIGDEAQARAAAERNGASVIVWGNYTADFVELNIHNGVSSAPTVQAIGLDMLRRTTDVRVRLTDERNQTVALPVLGVLAGLQTAGGDGYEVIRTLAIMNAVGGESAEVIDNTVAARVHRFFQYFVADTPRAIDEIDVAIEVDGGNPLLFVLRGTAHQRLNDLDESGRDIETAQRLGPAAWTSPAYLLGNAALIRGDLDAAIAEYTRIVERRPDDWFPVNYRAALYYLRGDYDLAKIDYDRALSLEPNNSFPYAFSALIALREGRIADARRYTNVVLERFPNPTFANRTIEALYGESSAIIFGPFFAAFTNLLLGQYDAVIRETEAASAVAPDWVEVYLLRGFAYCNLREYDLAEAAYTTALDIDPSFAVIYLLRAESRLRQGSMAPALADLDAVRQAGLGSEIDGLIDAALSGAVTCENFFEVEPDTETGA